MNQIAVAIDGPSGAGKSTIAKTAAKTLGFIYVDTGALYRTIGLAVFRKNFDALTPDEVISVLSEINITLKYIDGAQRVYLNGEDVSELIRTPKISLFASRVSVIPEVREFLLDMQRDIANKNNVIMDGRDIGTVILPNAKVKIFLTASDEKRAERRYLELCGKGIETTPQEVLNDMRKRDEKDSSRSLAPLKKADDAILLDTSELDLQQSINAVINIIKNATNAED